jgi:hypothetical protein
MHGGYGAPRFFELFSKAELSSGLRFLIFAVGGRDEDQKGPLNFTEVRNVAVVLRPAMATRIHCALEDNQFDRHG